MRAPQRGAAQGLFGVASALDDEATIDATIVYLRLALHLDPGNDAILTYLGSALETAKRPADAVRVYDRVPEPSPFYVGAQIAAADLEDGLDLDDRAMERLRALESRNGPEVAAALGDLHRSRRDWSAAIAAYDRALAGYGPPYAERHWSIFYVRGISHERLKAFEAAERDFLQALELKPDQPLVLNYLAYTWLELGRNYDLALAKLERAVAEAPEDGYIVDSLGWAHYRLGNYRKAVEILEQALDLAPYEPTINEHLGDAYWKVGRRREAVFMWRHALDLKPEPEREPILRVKLASGLEAGEAAERRAEAR